MIVKSSLKIGKTQYQFEVDDKDEMEGLNKAITLGNPRFYCDLCKNTDPEKFYLRTNKDKESNIYVKVKCNCGAESKLGQYKTGGFFWHAYEMYIPNTETKEGSKQEVVID